MLRRIALIIVPCVAVYTVAATLTSSPSPRAEPQRSRTAPTTSRAPEPARSGYIVASS